MRRSARAVLFDSDGRLVLIRRTRVDGETYLTTPGGGLQTGETWAQAAVRECAEELGATVAVGGEVWRQVWHGEERSTELRFLLARVVDLDPARRTGHEYSQPERGTYAMLRVGPADPVLDELRPVELVPLLRSDWSVLAARAARLAPSDPPAGGLDDAGR